MSTTREAGSARKRGHQHHPRNDGTRRRLALEVSPSKPLSEYSIDNVVTTQKTTITKNETVIEHSAFPENSSNNPSISPIQNKNTTTKCDIIEVIDLTICDDDIDSNIEPKISTDSLDKCSKSLKEDRNSKIRKQRKAKQIKNDTKSENKDMSLVHRPEAEGSSQSDIECEQGSLDPELEELSKLRCTSEMTEVVAEREKRRRRCADYPGLAFASSIFSSDTLMKFSIIRNELHNIMNSQLKRAESEVAALNRRIQLLEEDLERSEERLATATAKLAEASAAADESERILKALENKTNMEDDRVSHLEQQLTQAKLIAEEADKKYEEAARKLVLMEQDLERAEERADHSEHKIVELEEELRVVGNNLKSLEVSEEKANQREEEYKNQIKNLTTRLKEATRKEDEYSVTLKQVEQQLREAAVTREHSEDKIRVTSDKLREAEARAEFAERSVQKLQKEVDRLEDDLLLEKEKNKMLADEMEATLHDIQNM